MAYILSVGTSIPSYNVNQKKAIEFARNMFQDSFKDIERLLKAFENGEIESRQFVRPIEWYKENHSFGEKNRIYINETVKHCTQAVTECLTSPDFLEESIPYEKVEAIFSYPAQGCQPQALRRR